MLEMRSKREALKKDNLGGPWMVEEQETVRNALPILVHILTRNPRLSGHLFIEDL